MYLCASLSSCLAAAPQASGPSDDPPLYMVKLIQVGRPCFDDQQTRPQRLPLFSVRASIAFVSPCPCKHGTCVPASMAFVMTMRLSGQALRPYAAMAGIRPRSGSSEGRRTRGRLRHTLSCREAEGRAQSLTGRQDGLIRGAAMDESGAASRPWLSVHLSEYVDNDRQSYKALLSV